VLISATVQKLLQC